MIRAKNRAKIPSLEIDLSPGPCLGSLGVLRALCQSPCADLVRLLVQDPMEFLQVLSQDFFSASKKDRAGPNCRGVNCAHGMNSILAMPFHETISECNDFW